MNRAYAYVVDRRWLSVGTAVACEVAILVALAQLDTTAVVGVPGAVTAAIAGTIAVVYGALDGAFVALVGAAAFGTAAGWDAGELVSLALWPAIVSAVGLFARRVAHRRVALQQVLAAQELERKRVALELHDQIAQTLAGALMALRAAAAATERPTVSDALSQAGQLIHTTIQEVRELSVDLRPRVLDDYGVVAAVERLATIVSERSGIPVTVEPTSLDRLAADVELALYRIVEDALATALHTAPERVRLQLERRGRWLSLIVEKDGPPANPDAPASAFDGVRERVRLLGGRLTVESPSPGRVTVRAEIPA